MVRALSAGLLLVTWTATARAEESRASADAATAAGAPAASGTAPAICTEEAPTAEERAFSVELESFARRRLFTEQLMAKREAEAFERAALRQARAAELVRQLTEREAAQAEREFEEAVTLYLKKRELTRALSAAASRAWSTPADSTSVPVTAPSP